MTVVQYESPPPLPASRPGEELEQGPRGDVARLRAAAEYAAYIGDTEFVPDTLRGRPAAIAAAIIAGAELGLQPLVALRTIAIIKGRPTLSAEAQRGLVTSAGHELWFDESTTTRAIAAGRRAGSDRVGRITWTLDDAKRAGLAGQHNWRAYPAEMLRARSSAALARAMFADVTLGIPASEELDGEPDTVPPDDAPSSPPASTTRTRRRTQKPKPEPEPGRGPVAPTPPPDPQPEPPLERDPATEPPATDAQKRQLFALMRDVGLPADDREARLAYTIRAIGRQIESSSELTIADAHLAIDDLKAIMQLPPEERADRLLGEQEQAVLEPEPEAPHAAGQEPEALTRQRERVRALFFAKGIADEEERLAYCGGVLDRRPASLDELTPDEASQVIAHLEQYNVDDRQTWPFPDGF